jgi:hypothetical protein
VATSIVQRPLPRRQCGGVVEIVATEHFDAGGRLVGTTNDRTTCINGCLGAV